MTKTLWAAALAMTLGLAALPLPAGAAVPSQRPVDMGMGGSSATISVTAGLYRLTLVIGPLEPMYTWTQVKRLHPSRGEIMLRGAMMMGGMGMSMPNRHLELHVLDLRTMRPVADAMVSITYQPVVPMGMMAIRPTTVPPSVMMGIGVGMSDVHYGNNVYMPRGTYHVWVYLRAHATRARAWYIVRLM